MKKYLLSLLIISLIFMTVSCNGNQNENRNSEVQNPEALQDDIKLKSLSKRGGNLIDELYAELVEKTPELKKLETELESFQDKDWHPSVDFMAELNQYYITLKVIFSFISLIMCNSINIDEIIYTY